MLNDFGNIIKEFWLKILERFNNIELMEYVKNTNQIHTIINITGGAIHELPQQDYYGYIIISEKAYLKIAENILNNPERWNEDECYA